VRREATPDAPPASEPAAADDDLEAVRRAVQEDKGKK